MSLKDLLTKDLKGALLDGDRFRVDVIRSIKASILNKEVAENKRENGLSDAEIEGLLFSEVKKRKESLVIYQNNDREDLAEKEKKEIDIISGYLPKQLTKEELEQEAKKAIKSLNIADKKDFGKLMGHLKSKLGVSADGSMLALVVKDLLDKN